MAVLLRGYVAELFTQLSGLILCLVEVKTLCHPHSDTQQSLYTGPDYKKTNERGGELQSRGGLDKERGSEDRGFIWIYVVKYLELCSV